MYMHVYVWASMKKRSQFVREHKYIYIYVHSGNERKRKRIAWKWRRKCSKIERMEPVRKTERSIRRASETKRMIVTSTDASKSELYSKKRLTKHEYDTKRETRYNQLLVLPFTHTLILSISLVNTHTHTYTRTCIHKEYNIQTLLLIIDKAMK